MGVAAIVGQSGEPVNLGRQCRKAAARRHRRVAAKPLSPAAQAEAEAKASAAEAELLAMLELEEGAAGKAKGKAKGTKGKRG